MDVNEAFSKWKTFDILIEVKTVCRKTKVTAYADLPAAGVTLHTTFDQVGKEITSFEHGYVKLASLVGLMTHDKSGLSKLNTVIFPNSEGGRLTGIGQVSLVGYEAGGAKAALVSLPFDFSQEPGGQIKITPGTKVVNAQQASIPKSVPISESLLEPTRFRKLLADLKAFMVKTGTLPQLMFANTESVKTEKLRGKTFVCEYRENTHYLTGNLSVSLWVSDFVGPGSPLALCLIHTEKLKEEPVQYYWVSVFKGDMATMEGPTLTILTALQAYLDAADDGVTEH